MSHEPVCGERCQWCAKNWPIVNGFHWDGVHHVSGSPRCNAPTKDQYIAELEAERDRLKAAMDKSFSTGCWCDEHGHPCTGCETNQELTEAQKALAEERARLDWWERNLHVHHARSSAGISMLIGSTFVANQQPTLRAAIDAARTQGDQR